MATLNWLADHGEWVFVICQIVITCIMIFLGSKFFSKKDGAEVKALVVDAHHRIDLLDKDVKALPDFHTVNKLTEAVSGLQGDVQRLSANVRSLDEKADIRAASISRIEDHLLNHSERK